MLALFRTNQLILGIFLLGYALLLRFWLILGLGPGTPSADYPILSGWLWQYLAEPDWLSAVGTIILVWVQALLINSLVAGNRLTSEINLLPGLFFILVSSALPVFQDFSPFHLANTFLILSIGQLFKVYKQNHCMDFLFNAGLFVGLAGLCYGPYLWFLAPVLLGLSILRAFQGREWLAVLLGGFVPLFWMAVIGFLNDQLGPVWREWSAAFGFMSFDLYGISTGKMIGVGTFALLMGLVLVNYGANMQKTIIEVRKKIDILYWVLFFGLIATLFSGRIEMADLLLVCVPAGILLSFKFMRMSSALAEILHLVLLIGVLVLHYLTYAGVV